MSFVVDFARLRNALVESIIRYQKPETHLDKDAFPYFEGELPLQVTPAIPVRYEQVLRLLQAAILILSEQDKVHPLLLKEVLEPLVSPFELSIVEGQHNSTEGFFYHELIYWIKARGAVEYHTTKVSPYALKFREEPGERWGMQWYYQPLYRHNEPVPPDGDSPVFMAYTPRVVETPTPGFEDTEWSIVPAGEWAHWPSIHEYTSVLNSIDQLFKTGYGGHTPYSQIDQTESLLGIAARKLWHGFTPELGENLFSSVMNIDLVLNDCGLCLEFSKKPATL